jgi:hypothetical protein
MSEHLRDGPGRPPYEPSEKDRRTVRTMSAYGIPQHRIAPVIGVDEKTLRRHFRAELDSAEVQANAAVAGALYRNATEHNNVQAQIFWMKTRAQWREARPGDSPDHPMHYAISTGVPRGDDDRAIGFDPDDDAAD